MMNKKRRAETKRRGIARKKLTPLQGRRIQRVKRTGAPLGSSEQRELKPLPWGTAEIIIFGAVRPLIYLSERVRTLILSIRGNI